MSVAERVWDVYAIRYAVNSGQQASHNFIGGDAHDGPMPLDYFVWLIRNNEQTIVVDTGFNASVAAARGRDHIACPAATLARIGVDADTVEDVILTHLHYDHAGNHHLFPTARFHVQDREMAYATGRCMTHRSLRQPFEAEDIAVMVRRTFADRVVFHDGDWELADGVTVHLIGGHTAGLQVVRVRTVEGWLVLASDASHFYANIETERSFPIVYHVGDMLEGFRRLRELVDRPDMIVPGHDPLVVERYPAPSADLAGLIVRLDQGRVDRSAPDEI